MVGETSETRWSEFSQTEPVKDTWAEGPGSPGEKEALWPMGLGRSEGEPPSRPDFWTVWREDFLSDSGLPGIESQSLPQVEAVQQLWVRRPHPHPYYLLMPHLRSLSILACCHFSVSNTSWASSQNRLGGTRAGEMHTVENTSSQYKWGNTNPPPSWYLCEGELRGSRDLASQYLQGLVLELP